jgi:hypothetical protein
MRLQGAAVHVGDLVPAAHPILGEYAFQTSRGHLLKPDHIRSVTAHQAKQGGEAFFPPVLREPQVVGYQCQAVGDWGRRTAPGDPLASGSVESMRLKEPELRLLLR